MTTHVWPHDGLADIRASAGPHAAAVAFTAKVAAGSISTADVPVDSTEADAFVAAAVERSREVTALVLRQRDAGVPGLSPVFGAALLVEAGIPVIVELTNRDRNRVALEGELAALADIGVDAVLVRSDAEAPSVNDIDAAHLAALARRAGHAVVAADAHGGSDAADLRMADVIAPDAVQLSAGVPLPFDCPKHMTFGPCGGVNADHTCEVVPVPCVFLSRNLPVRWSGPALGDSTAAPTHADREVRAIRARRPVIVSGFPVRAMIAADIERTADMLRGSADVVLSGDAGRSRVQFPPSYRARLMVRAGMRVWMGVNARDRNRDALTSEFVSLREAGVAGVHCVTGDHTFTGDRPDAKPVFDLESTSMLQIARGLGLATSFAESPAAPPIDRRGARVRQKQLAGGQACWPQYCGDAIDVEAFITSCRDAGSDVPVFPGIPLIVDRDGAALLASFHAAKLPMGFVDALLDAVDVRRAGIRLAIDYGQALLDVRGVGGLVVAGGVRYGDEADYARALAEVSRELGGGS